MKVALQMFAFPAQRQNISWIEYMWVGYLLFIFLRAPSFSFALTSDEL